MKRWIAGVMSLCILLAWGCAKKAAPADTPADTPAPTAEATLVLPADTPAPTVGPPEATDAPAVRARQYGEEMALVVDQNGLTGKLYYPAGDVGPVNEGVRRIVELALYNCETKAAAANADADGMRATVSVDYDAYLVNGRFLGVKESGEYHALDTDTRDDILDSFNYDLAAGRELALSDVIDAAQLDAVCTLLAERLAWLDATALAMAGTVDAEHMQHFVLRNDGIEWLFAGADAPVGVLLDYETLAPHLCLFDSTPAPTAADASETAPYVESEAISLHDGVHIRSLPSTTDGEILDTVDANTPLSITDAFVTKGWHEIWYNGRTAFVYARLVQIIGGDTAYTTGWVVSNYLHVRDRAGTDGALVGTMRYQQRVRVVDPNPVSGWYRIWYEGKVAYAYAAYVYLGTYPTDTPAPGGTPSSVGRATAYIEPRIIRDTQVSFTAMGTCAADGLLVRCEPNANAAPYGTMERGDQVYILLQDCAPGWDKVFVHTSGNTGYIGYVRASYVFSE